MNITIEKAKSINIKEIKKLINQEDVTSTYSVKDALKTDSLYIAKDDNKIIGVVRWHPRQDETNSLQEIAVDSKYQNQGIGKRLFDLVPLPIRLKTTKATEKTIERFSNSLSIDLKLFKTTKGDLIVEKTDIQYIGLDLQGHKSADKIGDLITSHLTDDLLKPSYLKNKSHMSHQTEGHCYHASECLYFLTGAKETWKPMGAKDSFGGSHWWLESKLDKSIKDLTKNQYIHKGIMPPYGNGKGRGFLPHQSFSSLIIMKKVLTDLDNDPKYEKNINEVIAKINKKLKISNTKYKKHSI